MSQEQLQALGKKLKTHRESLGISLTDISFSTRINQKFLEQIEAGIPPKLPETYLRSFLREYAESIQLDVNEVTEEYLNLMSGEKAEKDTFVYPEAHAGKKRKNTNDPHVKRRMIYWSSLSGIILVLIVAWTLYDSYRELTPSPAEIPIEDQISNQEDPKLPFPVTAVDSLPRSLAFGDSLQLQILARDTVNVIIIIDGRTTKEIRLLPNRTFTVNARNRFEVTYNKARSVFFTLNGKQIPQIVRRADIDVRREFNRTTLDTLSN